MNDTRNFFLIAGAAASALAAILHIGCIVFGASWYRFFGAGERMAQMANAGSWYPVIVTLLIATILAICSLYVLSGAGLLPRLTFLRPALCLIAGIYLLRGFAGFAFVVFPLGRSPAFWWWSSAICLSIGVLHLFGLRHIWARL